MSNSLKTPKSPSPMQETISIQPYLLRPDPEDCKCDVHGFETRKARYRQLADKTNCEMTDLTSLMLDSVCDMEKIKSIYKTDYQKRGISVIPYKQLMAIIDSTEIIDLKDSYRDPTRFRSLESQIQPFKTTCLPNDMVSGPCSFWGEPFTGYSEYMDTISKMGLTNMKTQQRYLAPLFPVPKKLGDCSSLIKD